MRLVSPKIEVERYDGQKIMKYIERACRVCYKSEGLITNDSYKRLIKNCIKRGHGSVLEHEKISVRMICDIGVYKDLTRHRTGTAFSIQSTRWCNYSRDKFGNELSFIEPVFFDQLSEDDEVPPTRDQLLTMRWYDAMEVIENTYLQMAEEGAKPDELRMILPHSTASEMAMTCNIREWKHILELRTTKQVHPAIRQLLIPLLLNFKENMPEIFEDVEYDKDFPKEKYAELVYMEE